MAQHNVVAYFDSRAEAERARDALLAEGVAASSIRLLPENGSSHTRSATTTAYDQARDEGGFWSSLSDLFLPEEDRYAYAEGMSRGGVTLAVMADEAQLDRVSDILERHGSVDLDAREAEWRRSGWTGYAAGATSATGTTTGATTGVATGAAATDMASDRVVGRDEVIPVVEEQIRVGKRAVEAGRVRVRSYVVETPVEAEVELRQERVTIERRPVDRPVTAGDAVFREQTIEAVERREEPVVAKEARVVEEIGLREQTEVERQTVRDTVRKTEVEVEDERVEGTRLTDADRDLTGR